MQRATDKKKKEAKSNRLDFRPAHIFRVKSEQSLAHLRQSRDFAPCLPCSQESQRRPSTTQTKRRILGPTPADLERLSRPKTAGSLDKTNDIQRPPFVNYGARYDDKQFGEKRTFNSFAVHQMKHQQSEENRLRELMRERRLRLQAENYFREMEERRARAQDLQDRFNRSSTEYRDSFKPPQSYN